MVVMRDRRVIRPSRRPAGRRGFTAIEILVVLAILGIIAGLAAPRIIALNRRMSLEGTSAGFRSFVQQAGVLSQRRNLAYFVVVNPRISDPGQNDDLSRPVQLVEDTNGNGTYDAGTDVVVNTMTIPPGISLSRTDPTIADQTLWQVTGSGAASVYSLGVDLRGRTITPTTGAPITGVATMSMTHTGMVTSAVRPLVDFQLRINPLFNVSVNQVTVP